MTSLTSWLMALAAIAVAATRIPKALLDWQEYRQKKAAPTSTSTSTLIQSSSRWAGMSWLDRAIVVSGLLSFTISFLLLLAATFVAPATPASSRDVVGVGLLVSMIVITSRPS